jgi:site-specific DNA-methyltransferase (adenine-specific)
MTSHDLIGAWQAAYEAAGRYAFAPVGITQDRVRLGGDGPASGLVYLMVARPKTRAFSTWGALPGFYHAGIDREGHIGGKPLGLMRRIVADYSRPGDLICDPCAGGGTTLVAAHALGRRAVGAECDADTFAKAQARIMRGVRQPILALTDAVATQGELL